MIRRGDIRWFRFDRPDKRRPVLVLGQSDSLESWSQVPVIPLSTQIRGLAWEVALTPEDGLPTACVLKPEWIRAVDRSGLGPLVATLAESRWDAVERAVLLALGFGDPS
jgi:mRNA interferase MazF